MATPAQLSKKNLPVIALVGRVNVGKSTLFNRLIEEKKAIVSDIPGTTRTNNEGFILWRGTFAKLIDTGGLTFTDAIPLEADILKQSLRAVKEADVVVFVTDGQEGVLPQERRLAELLRRKIKKPIFLIANKVDTNEIQSDMSARDWLQLGLGDPFPVSGVNGRNLGDLLDQIFAELRKGKRRPKSAARAETETPIRVAIIGKPNVGKSSLFNKFIGEEKVIVSPMPHTTREPHDTLVIYRHEVGKRMREQPILFIDTAGIRRKAQVEGALEREGIQKSITTIEESEIVLFVIDGSEPISSQDRQLGGLLEKRVKSVVIIINKWDLATDNSDAYRNEVKRMVYSHFPHVDFAPIVFASGLTGYKTNTMFPLLMHIWQARHTEIPAEALREFLRDVTRAHRPTKGRGTRHPEIVGMRQLGINPPVFEIYIKYRTSIHPSYIHFLERSLRERFDFTGTPIMIKVSKMKR